MAIYIVTYALYFFILAIGLTTRNLRLWLVIATIPMLALVWMRGNVGVDLPNYVQLIQMIQKSEGFTWLFEPGFEFLILTLSKISSDPTTIAKMIATLTTLLLLSVRWKTKTAYQVLGLGIIPYYYIDMTMNGLRYGLAFSIALLSVKFLLSTRQLRFFFSTLGAASIQVSSLYLHGLLQFIFRPKFIILFVPLVIATGLIGTDYLINKVSINLTLTKPSITSGLGPLLLSIVLIIGCCSDSLIRRHYSISILFLFLLSFLTYVISQISYAGLRLQQLNSFLIMLFLIYASERNGRIYSKNLFQILLIISLMGTALRLKNFISEAGVGDAPFMPYTWYWEH